MSYRLLKPIIEVYAIKTQQIKPMCSNQMPEPQSKYQPPSSNVNIDTFSQQQPYSQPPSFAQPPPYAQPPSYPPPTSNAHPPMAPPPSYPPSYN